LSDIAYGEVTIFAIIHRNGNSVKAGQNAVGKGHKSTTVVGPVVPAKEGIAQVKRIGGIIGEKVFAVWIDV